MADPDHPPLPVTSPFDAAPPPPASPRGAAPLAGRAASMPAPTATGPPPSSSLRRLSTRVSATLRRISATGAVTPEATLTPGARRLLSVRASEWARDEALRKRAEHGQKFSLAVTLFIAWQALGVIYGDIGTSPLYTLETVFEKLEAPPSRDDILGVVSIIVWELTLLLLIKYTFIVLRAHDGGQGGTFALYSILKRQGASDAAARSATASVKAAAAADRDAAAGLSGYTRAPESGGSTTFRRRASVDGRAGSAGRRAPVGRLLTPRGGGGASPPVSPSTDTRFDAAAWAADGGEAGFRGSTRPPPPDWRQKLVAARWMQRALKVVVVVGVGAILGDGTLTPSISVISAVEGLGRPLPTMFAKGAPATVAVAAAILALLFMVQRFGTGGVAIAFSPLAALWFGALAAMGIYNLASHGRDGVAALSALSPHHAFLYFKANGFDAWVSLGSTALAITGAEALFADRGHFTMPAIQIATTAVVYPALVLQYLGQAAVVLADPRTYKDEAHGGTGPPFWVSIPKPVYYPVLALAIIISVVASQALITASYSIVVQALAHGFFPRVYVQHTSRRVEGQIYIPAVNYALLALCLTIVLAFRSSTGIADAYGIAVLLDMLLTTILCTLVMLSVWRAPVILAAAFFVVFFTVEGVLWSSTLRKVVGYGWMAIIMAVMWGGIMAVWSAGTAARRTAMSAPPLTTLLDAASAGDDVAAGSSLTVPVVPLRHTEGAKGRIARARGVAMFYSDTLESSPPVLAHLLARMPVLYQVNIFLTNRFVPLPEVGAAERLLARDAGVEGFFHVVARYGYMERPAQDAAFAAAVVDHVLGRMYERLARAAAADDGLRAALGLPADFAALVAAEALRSGSGPARPDAVARTPSLLAGGTARTTASGGLPTLVEGSTPSDSRRGSVVAEPGAAAAAAADDAGAAADAAAAASRRASVRTMLEWAVAAVGPRGPRSLPDRYASAAAAAAECRVLAHARAQNSVVYVIGAGRPLVAQGGGVKGFFRRLFVGLPFVALVRCFQEDAASAFGVPRHQALEVALPYEV